MQTFPSLSGTLAKRTKPTLRPILPKSLPALPTPTHSQIDDAEKNGRKCYEKNKQRNANKRYSKCGVACSLKHL
jgi:hypothetical protein